MEDDVRNGVWNMIDRTFFEPKTLNSWVVVSFVGKNRLPNGQISDYVRTLVGTSSYLVGRLVGLHGYGRHLITELVWKCVRSDG